MAQKLKYFAYAVKFDFKGEDDTTLHVKKGEIVLGSEKSLPPGSWVLVQQSVAPHRHGYVPAQYLERAQDDAFLEKDVSLPDGSGTKDKLVHRGTKLIDKLLKDNNAHFYDDFGNWNSAIKEFSKGNRFKAFDLLQYAPEGTTSRVSFNQGVVCFLTAHYHHAIFFLSQAVTLDCHLAVAHFMRGVCFYRCRDYLQAFMDFSHTLDILKPNEYIDYIPLGLEFVLWKAEILYNRSLCFAGLKLFDRALQDCSQSKKFSHSDSHLKRVNMLEKELRLAQENCDISEVTTGSEVSDNDSDCEDESARHSSSPSMRDGRGHLSQRKSRPDSSHVVTVDKEARLKVRRPERGPPAPPGEAPSPATHSEALRVPSTEDLEVKVPVIQHRPSMASLEPPKNLQLSSSPPSGSAEPAALSDSLSQPPPRKPRRNISKAVLSVGSPDEES